MITPAKMLKVRLIVYHRDYDFLLESLHGKGILHFTDFSENAQRWGFKGVPNAENYDDLLDLYKEIQGLIDILEGEQRRSFIDDLVPRHAKIAISGEDIPKIKEKVAEYKAEVSKIETEKAELEKQRAEIESHRTALELLEGFRGQIEKTELPKNAQAFYGELAADDLPPVLISLKDSGLDKFLYYKKIIKGEEKRAVLLVLCSEAQGEVLGRILDSYSFQHIPIPQGSGSVKEMLGKVRTSFKDLENKDKEIRMRVEQHAETYLGVLVAYLAKVKYTIDMMKVRNMSGKTGKTMLIGGWIKEKDKAFFESMVNNATGKRAEISYFEPDVRKGDIPVAMDNPSFIKPFELLTTMFSPPNYGEIDPTPFLAVAFVLFFGIMFADIFDALLLLGMSLLFYSRFKESEEARNLGEILIVCSLSALAFGLIGGDFAGFSVWTKSEILQPTNLLIFALFLGLIQIIIGYILGAVDAIRSKDIDELLGGKIGWLLIIAGVGLAYFFSWQLLLLSALGLLFVFAFKGLREALDLTRLLSNLLSYVRLLALNMAHVGLSATFASIVGGLFSLGFVGEVSGGILIIIAHVFLVVVSLFAVFAHALRLQYVEFFSKFYEGGGTIFNPF